MEQQRARHPWATFVDLHCSFIGCRLLTHSNSTAEALKQRGIALKQHRSVSCRPLGTPFGAVTLFWAAGGAENLATCSKGYHRSAPESRAALLPLCKALGSSDEALRFSAGPPAQNCVTRKWFFSSFLHRESNLM